MGQAYEDGGKWWVDWDGSAVPNGAQFSIDSRRWIDSNNTGRAPAFGYQYRVPATTEQIAAAKLRAELPMADIQDRQDAFEEEVGELGVKVVALAESKGVCIGGPLPPQPGDWHLKSWGRTRQIFVAEGVEIWESEGKAGHRTSWHRHPNHLQHTIHVVGKVQSSNGESTLESDEDGGVVLNVGESHELRFLTDCRFIEVYTGQGSVMDSIERIYR